MSDSEKSALKQNGGAREGSGRKPLLIADTDRQKVEEMSGFGVPFEQIAAVTCNGINVTTLRKYFSQQLIDGKAKANNRVGMTLFEKAMNGDTTAMIWWTKSQMRWSEVRKHEVTGADGGPVEYTKIERVIIDVKPED